MRLLSSLVLTRAELLTLQSAGAVQVCRPILPQPCPMAGRTTDGDEVLWVTGLDGRVAGWWKSVYDRTQAGGDYWGKPFVVQTGGLVGWEMPVQEDFRLLSRTTGCYEADGVPFTVPETGILADWRDHIQQQDQGSQPAYLLPLALCRYMVRLTDVRVAPVDSGSDADFIQRGAAFLEPAAADAAGQTTLRATWARRWNAQYAALGLPWKLHPWSMVQVVEMVTASMPALGQRYAKFVEVAAG